MDRISTLVEKTDPKFVAQLAYVAREEFNLRSVTHLLLSKLAQIHKGDDLVKRALEKTIIRPDDMIEIAALLKMKLQKIVRA